ncbi:TonB-dependent receptor [Lysobacter sp. SG-8]|uniref:TonB-dependent receptor n=1 Tax=Marilutibacter penaei TaxID=2759900 RepID=A0A7W3YDB7_9GAMM|nr:TonB-dependent receptor [Lysobacter penaei]MBB1086882.1 TonB-dependent receptor [Lysobacter penaei]
MNHLRSAVRVGLLPASIALALTPVIAGAQEADTGAEATTLDRIEVTGSRIRGADMETQQPIITIGRQEIEQQGLTSVADILQNITAAGSPAISRAEALASGENVGGYYIDLRNLGATRTLVLVNGKRLPATTGGYQDLSQIPTSAIDRIEILKDGASAIYGSDAIAGVVNVITRKRYDGAEANAYIGQYSEGDGEIEQYSFTMGANGDRGGVTLSVEYSKEDPVLAGDRWFSAYGNAGPDYPGSGWSPVSHNGSWLGPCGPGGADAWCTLNAGGDPTNVNDYHVMTPDEYANSNQQMFVRTGIERKSVFANANYDISDRINFNADVLYNHRTTDQQIAGYPYQSGAFDTPLSGDSAFNPIGQDIEFRRRLWEVPRTTKSELETYMFSGGFNGYFDIAGKPWDWDVGAMLGEQRVTKRGHGDASLFATADALGPSFINADGVAQCGTAADPIGLDACRPWNPLLPNGVAGQGSLSDPELQKFLFPYYTDTGLTETKSYTANLTGSLFELPAGDLGIALGYEHRKESGRFVPDAFAQTGMSTGLGATTTEGAYDLDEFYMELNIPVLADMPFAQELTFNAASRYSDYSNFGDTINSKFGFTWRPVQDVLVRGTWAEGFRAPSIDNLYGGIGTSFEDYTDPCGVGAVGSVNGNAACTSAGVPLGYVQLGQGLVPCTSYPCQTPDQFVTGSNANLIPETSESQTVGLVWSPRWVEGLDISLDWYKYELQDMIIADSVDRILRDCYVLDISSRCAGIERAADGHITNMFYGLANLGSMETEGYDLGVKYRLPEFSFGKFVIDFQNTYTSKYDQAAENSDGDPITVGYVGTPGIFRLRSNLGVNYEFGDFGINYAARYYSGMKESCVPNRPCTNPDRYANGEPDAVRWTGSNTFHDVQFSWRAPWNGTVAVGANNVFNHQGPIMFSQPNSNYAYYGGFDIGRVVYMKYQQRF